VADLLLLGVEHHRLVHFLVYDEGTHSIWCIRLLRRRLRYWLDLDYPVLPRGVWLDARGNQEVFESRNPVKQARQMRRDRKEIIAERLRTMEKPVAMGH